jgi:hypothetical protein
MPPAFSSHLSSLLAGGIKDLLRQNSRIPNSSEPAKNIYSNNLQYDDEIQESEKPPGYGLDKKELAL